MSKRALLAFSVGLNVVLALLWWQATRTPDIPFAEPSVAAEAAAETSTRVKTNVIVRRWNISWHDIESTNYWTYIANLRAISCPEQTIREIIISDVNDLFERRRTTEITTGDHQWWLAEPNLDVLEEAARQVTALEAEKKALLAQLLGPQWDTRASTRPPPGLGTSLDGPLLGSLSTEAKQAVRDIESRGIKRRQEYLERQSESGGLPPDSRDLARLRQETRQELSQVLGPAELEEYLLRYSHTAERMREQLHGVEVTPEEFRSIFRMRDPLEQQLAHAGSDTQPGALAAQTDAALLQVLGPERYRMYQYQQDPGFRDAQSSAESAGAPAEVVLPLYEIQRATDLERQRIAKDSSLSEEQRAAALEAAVSQQLESVRRLLGDSAYERYLKERLLNIQ